MSANESDTTQTDSSTDTDRWQYTGRGSLSFAARNVEAGTDDVATQAILHPPRDGQVRAAITIAEADPCETPTGWTSIDLDPDAAEALARDLIECAAVAREQAGESNE